MTTLNYVRRARCFAQASGRRWRDGAPGMRCGAKALTLALALTVSAAALAGDVPLTELPYTPGLDPAAMDRDANPCQDFYQYACGGWMRNNPIPPDQSSWSVYHKLGEENLRYLWGILDGLQRADASRHANQQKLGDYFAACMDEGAAERRGATPLQAYFERISALTQRKQLAPLLGDLHASLAGAPLFFSFGSGQDYGDSTRVISFANAGGLGLPERDYYLKTDARSRQMREAYRAHVERMTVLSGATPAEAKRAAAAVMRIETALARASLAPVDRRDPYKLYHRMTPDRLQRLTPDFDWPAYFAALGAPAFKQVNVSEPEFYKALGQVWRAAPLADVRAYLRWHVASALSPVLAQRFVAENFSFYGKTLNGVEALKPRWKRCVALVDAQLGEALGQEFVSRTFSPELKEKTLHMTHQIETAMRERIEASTWMGAATKRKALEKLEAVVNKIGYPDRWRDYSAYLVARDDLVGNLVRGNRFETARQLAKIGKPLDRSEWLMTPPTVNAYYDPQMNDINFPAGILQPPLYDPRMDDAPNYGNTGATIAHELTHAFDDEGRKFDARGNLRDWWTRKDAKAFEQRAQCIVKQYAQYVVVDDVRINSRLTLGEDVADLGGLVLAWMAWQMQYDKQPSAARDGLTPEQRFFVGNAQWACENNRPEKLRVQAATDPHSPGKYRVNGLVVNLPEFSRAFSCQAGDPMVSRQPCQVW